MCCGSRSSLSVPRQLISSTIYGSHSSWFEKDGPVTVGSLDSRFDRKEFWLVVECVKGVIAFFIANCVVGRSVGLLLECVMLRYVVNPRIEALEDAPATLYDTFVSMRLALSGTGCVGGCVLSPESSRGKTVSPGRRLFGSKDGNHVKQLRDWQQLPRTQKAHVS